MRLRSRYVLLLSLVFSHSAFAALEDNVNDPASLLDSQISRSFYISSFSSAKRHLLKLYNVHRQTFYCSCGFDSNKSIDASNCGYEVRKSATRGNRVEWEHVVPAHRFGAARICWQVPASFEKCERRNGKILSGRKCCRKVDTEFRAMEADMMNLVPTVGELNADRSNYSFGQIEGEPRIYGQCDFEIDRPNRLAEPAAEVRGDIARIYLYFADKYQMPLTEPELNQFLLWSENDPVSIWELEKKVLVDEVLQRVGKPRIPSTTLASDGQ